MLEGNCFDKFLDSARDLALVAPCVESLQVRCDACEVVGYGFATGSILAGDAGGDGSLKGADTIIVSRLATGVWREKCAQIGRNTHR